jgi:Predicted flavin-nucleotide-binding protein
MTVEMRRKDRQMTDEEARKILEEGLYGILSTVDKDLQPYGIPISYVLLNGSIYIHGTNAGGHKYTNIESNNRVSFTVVGKTQVLPDKFSTLYESAIAFGTIETVSDEEERLLAFREFLNKYSPDFFNRRGTIRQHCRVKSCNNENPHSAPYRQTPGIAGQHPSHRLSGRWVFIFPCLWLPTLNYRTHTNAIK